MATVMFLILFIVVLVASLLGLFAIFSVYVGYVHWKYSHIPAPKRESFFLGHVPLIARELERGKIMDEVLDELHRIHGSVVLIWLYHKPLVFLSDPELAKKCLVTLNLPKNPFSYTSLGFPFGQRMAGNGLVTQIDHGVWQKRRTVLNPAFHRRHLMNFMSAFNNSCDLFLNKLDEIADGKTIVDMAQEFSRVTLDVIGKVAFNVDVNVIEDANSPFPTAIATCLEGVQSSFRTPFWRINVPQFPFQKSVSQATRFVRDYAKKVIQERQEAILRGDDTPLDILAHILSLAEAEPSLTLEDMVDEFVTFYFADVTRCHLVAHLMLENFLVMIIVKETPCGTYTRFGYWANHYVPNEKERYHLYKQPKNKRVMSLLFTGQETTSNQLSFTLYEILKNSDIENRLVQEIEAVLGSRQFVEYKDLGNLQYLGQTLKEGLRLHPPAEATSRITTRDDYFAGHLLPKGTSVLICWFILHRLPDLWPEPRKFDPERFSSEAKSPGHGQSAPYFPFSLGPRTCIGQTFAQFEARVLMARLLQEFELSLLPGQNELRHEERLTLRPKGGVLCTIKRRGTVS